jgi:hypothetical protein
MAFLQCASHLPGAMPVSPLPEPLTIGWKEYLDLPDLGVFHIKTKIDTGARTSTLHVDSFTVLDELPDGTGLAEVVVSPDRRRPDERVTARVRVLRYLTIRDSGGHPEVRPLIETEMVLGTVRKRIRLTLTDRSGMLFRMILGRKALEGSFHVDVARKYRLRRSKREIPGEE